MTYRFLRSLARTNILLLGLGAIAAGSAPSAAHAQDDVVIPAGSLLIRTSGANGYVAVPRVATRIAVHVSGFLAHATVRQSFLNPGTERVEAVYVFPLPEGAAVERLRVRIGERTIESRVVERGAAQARYEAARLDGAAAALLEMERPNLFTVSVNGIGPEETVEVSFEYRETLRFADGNVSLRLPLVVAPRFVPGGRGTGNDADAARTPAVPDAHRVTPPVRRPAAGPANPVIVTATLHAGVPLSKIDSPSHDITIEPTEGGHAVALKTGAAAADRDFVLRWTPALGHVPTATLFKESRGGQHFYRSVLLPPDRDAIAAVRPREIVFLVDTSGSMAGMALEQVRLALQQAVDRLQPTDRFDIVRFSGDVERLFSRPARADERARAAAHRFIAGFEARGGTELLPALHEVMKGLRDPERVRQIVLLTDGALANERQLFAAIRDRIGDTRLFTVGIGGAQNDHFLRGAARHGRGSHLHISRTADVADRMAALFDRLSRPAVTDITVRLVDAEGRPVHGEIWPRRVGDLHAGDPVAVSIRAPRAAAIAVFEGNLDGAPWRIEQRLDPDAESRPGIATLWAREKIEGLTDAMLEADDAERAELRKAILALGLVNDLVTEFTAMIAVDTTPSEDRPDEPAARRAVPLNLPDGWNYGKIFDDPDLPNRTLHMPMDLRGTLSPTAPSILRGVPWRTGTAAPPADDPDADDPDAAVADAGAGAAGAAGRPDAIVTAAAGGAYPRPTEHVAAWLAAVMGLALLLLLAATRIVRSRRR